ncbi:MAG TPA: HAD family hydrolase [Chthoniobacterales bacterium]
MSNQRIVFFFDIDNTLLDNDRVTKDIAKKLDTVVGETAQKRYWEIFEQLRKEEGYADYLAALQKFRFEDKFDPKLIYLSLFLTDYPFANRIFPSALDVIDRANEWGQAVILSDGDVVFQPRKAFRAGLLDAVGGRALIYIHKEEELADAEKRYPADHYVMFDDKLRILEAMKKIWGAKLTTVFVRQGHYAFEPGVEEKYAKADLTIDHIGDALNFTRDQFILAAYHS